MTAIEQPQRERGALIVFEGIDRSGKSTQTSSLAASLAKDENIPSLLLRFPNRSSQTGSIISPYLSSTSSSDLSDETIHLLFSANRWESVKTMKQCLLGGTTLVVDRYAYSGVAYTVAKGGKDIEWCKGPDRGLLTPDLVIYLDVPVEVSAGRGGFGEERYETREFQEKVKGAFQVLMKNGDERWHAIDARRRVEDIQSEILEIVLNVVAEVRTKPLREDLWM